MTPKTILTFLLCPYGFWCPFLPIFLSCSSITSPPPFSPWSSRISHSFLPLKVCPCSSVGPLEIPFLWSSQRSFNSCWWWNSEGPTFVSDKLLVPHANPWRFWVCHSGWRTLATFSGRPSLGDRSALAKGTWEWRRLSGLARSWPSWQLQGARTALMHKKASVLCFKSGPNLWCDLFMGSDWG